MRLQRVGPLAILLAFASGGCSQPGSLGDGDAKALIERFWNDADVGLVLGSVTFVSENANMAKGRESLKEWPLYEAFVKNGVLRLQNVRDLTGQFTGWNDWLSLTQSGVRKTATVLLTEQGKVKGTVKHVGDFDELLVKVAETKIGALRPTMRMSSAPTGIESSSVLTRTTFQRTCQLRSRPPGVGTL